MELFGFITAVAAGFILAGVREYKTSSKVNSINSITKEIADLSQQLYELNKQGTDVFVSDDIVKYGHEKNIDDMMATIKFLRSYASNIDAGYFNNVSFYINTPYIVEDEDKSETETNKDYSKTSYFPSKDRECYI